eukprot:4067162-Prymnesium_polylepis.1
MYKHTQTLRKRTERGTTARQACVPEVLAALRPRGCVHCKAPRIYLATVLAPPGQRRLAPRDAVHREQCGDFEKFGPTWTLRVHSVHSVSSECGR